MVQARIISNMTVGLWKQSSEFEEPGEKFVRMLGNTHLAWTDRKSTASC